MLIDAIKTARNVLQIAVPAARKEDPQKFAAELLLGEHRTSWVHTYPMDTAQTDVPVLVDGDFIHAWSDGGLDGVYIRPNNKTIDNNIFYFKRRNPIVMEFQMFYLTFPAKAGKTLDIMVGREASAEAQTTEVTVSSEQKFYSLRSDKDTHFYGAIAQNAKEDEDLAGLLSNKIRITGVSIQADENLDFRVIFWKTDGFDDTDLDLDRFCGEVELDLPTNGYRIGAANQYYLDMRGLEIDYEDEDASNELHVSLMCLTAAGKTAAAAGEVVVEVYYELRT